MFSLSATVRLQVRLMRDYSIHGRKSALRCPASLLVLHEEERAGVFVAHVMSLMVKEGDESVEHKMWPAGRLSRTSDTVIMDCGGKRSATPLSLPAAASIPPL
jgi:hypothetical protein